MVDANRMAVHHGIQNLKKCLFGKKVIPDKVASLGDAGKQVAFRTKLNDYKGAVNAIHDADQRHHIGMPAGKMMEFYLSLLEFSLSGVESEFVEGFHGIGYVGVNVDGGVDDSISPDP